MKNLKLSQEEIPFDVIESEDLEYPAIWDFDCGVYLVKQFNQGGFDCTEFEFDKLLMWVINNKRSSIDSILAHHGFRLEKQGNPAP